MELVIECISKKFKEKKAIDSISLNITPGVWGLLGANGAGKTTLMRIIAGIINPSSGQVSYDGVPIHLLKDRYREVFGYLPQNFGYDNNFTVIDYLEYMASLKGLSVNKSKIRIEELSERLTLFELKNKKISNLSGGMKQRVGIAQALLNEPQILILDEPTSGLDPGERIRFRNLLSEFSRNRIVLISTHIVSDIEYISSMNAVLKEGKIKTTGTTEELVQLVNKKVWSCIIHIEDLYEYDKKVRIISMKNVGEYFVSIRYLSEKSIDIGSKSIDPCMEDFYLWMFPQESILMEKI